MFTNYDLYSIIGVKKGWVSCIKSWAGINHKEREREKSKLKSKSFIRNLSDLKKDTSAYYYFVIVEIFKM